MADKTIRGAAGDGEEVLVAAGGQLTGDQGAVDLECLLFLEPTPPNNSDASTHYISLTEQQFRRAVDVNGRLYVAITDADGHGRDTISKIISGVRTPKFP